MHDICWTKDRFAIPQCVVLFLQHSWNSLPYFPCRSRRWRGQSFACQTHNRSARYLWSWRSTAISHSISEIKMRSEKFFRDRISDLTIFPSSEKCKKPIVTVSFTCAHVKWMTLKPAIMVHNVHRCHPRQIPGDDAIDAIRDISIFPLQRWYWYLCMKICVNSLF